jgi:hypothetical protein
MPGVRAQVAPSDASAKLTSALAALAAAVPQDLERATVDRASAGPQLSIGALPKPVQDAIGGRFMRINDSNEVQVSILMPAVTDENLRQLAAAGATVEIQDAPRHRVQARVPVSRLQMIAGLAFIDFIRLPNYARHRTGLTTTEGDTILHADAVRQQLSLDGTGVRVGVISDGIKGLFAAQCTTCRGAPGGPIATGDLPDAVGSRNAAGVLVASTGGVRGRSFQSNGDLEGLPPSRPVCGFSGAGAEGTALLEIVHDLAPGAQLAFANADTDLAFNQAVNYLASTNDIVVDDLGFYGEPYDGTGSISSNTAAALNNPAWPIRGYYTSVGNGADEHYYGAWADSGVDGTGMGLTTAGNLHLFQQTSDTTDVLALGPQPFNLIVLPSGGEVVIFLSWDDPAGASANNYDLYLVEMSTKRVVAASTDVQRGAQDPLEFIDFVNNGASGSFQIVVQNVRNAARPRHLNLFSFQPECANDGPRLVAPPRHERHNYNTATDSVGAQSDAGGSPVSVVSVGAICSASATSSLYFKTNPNESCNDITHSTVEFFSSRGPTLDGRQKPDVSAIDGVSVTGAGGFDTTFFGTSAAVPHVAGIAALLLQSAPCLLDSGVGAGGGVVGIDAPTARAALRSLVVDHATLLSPAGVPDNTSGAGRVDAAASAKWTLPTFTGSPTITVDATSAAGATLTASQLGFSDPHQCQLPAMSWTGGCGSGPGATMTCPRGTSQITVGASNNGLSFSAPVDLQIVVR